MFLGRILGSLLKTVLPLIKNVIKPLTESSSSPHNTTLIISNDKMKDFIEIVKSPEDSSLLLKGVSEIIQNEAKE